MIDKKTIVIFILMAVAVFLGTQWHKMNVRKLEEKKRVRELDIKLNPHKYYVYEGGTKPDPVLPEEPAKLSDE